jgi:hypothetical protein
MENLIYKEDFMCVCSAKNKRKSIECYTRIKEEVCGGGDDLLSGIAMALEHGLEEGYYGYIDGIHADQWFGVSISVLAYDESDGKYLEIGRSFVQCDLAEHGIARGYELAKEIVKEHKEKNS